MKIHPTNCLVFFGCYVLLCTPFMAGAHDQGSSIVGAQEPQPQSNEASRHSSPFLRNMHRQEFLDAKQCQLNFVKTEIQSNMAKSCSLHKGINAQACAANQKLQDAAKSSAASVVCSGDPLVLRKNFQKAVKVAAKEGDPDAQICYISGAFNSPSDVNIEQYKKDAPRYLQLAIKRGDWRGVALLTTNNQLIADRGAGLMPSLDIIAKPFTIYRGNRLLELGSTGGLREVYAERARTISSKLTPAQIVNANVWAAQMYAHHFDRSTKLTSPPGGCTTK